MQMYHLWDVKNLVVGWMYTTSLQKTVKPSKVCYKAIYTIDLDYDTYLYDK